MRLALYQPDIPQNTGAILRIAACFRVPVDIIEPCGFLIDDKRLRRAAMDYGGTVDFARHTSWERFLGDFRQKSAQRLVLLTTTGAETYTEFAFLPGDTLLLGRESAGVPPEVHNVADARVRVPIAAEMRSLNVAVAGAVVLAEALRQQGSFAGKAVL